MLDSWSVDFTAHSFELLTEIPDTDERLSPAAPSFAVRRISWYLAQAMCCENTSEEHVKVRTANPQKPAIGGPAKVDMAKISRTRAIGESTEGSAGPLAGLASYSSLTENDFARAIDTGLGQLGETAARKFDEEFPKWLRRFSADLKEYPDGPQNWAEIAVKCGAMEILVPLYLFTYPGKTSSRVFQDQFRLLTRQLDSLVRMYANTRKHTRALLKGRELSWLMLVQPPVHSLLKQQLDSLGVAEAQLKGLRQIAKGQGSRKTDPSDETLYRLASTVRQGTGSFKLAQIATLLQVANSAHGGAGQIIDAEKLKKRLYRFRKRHKRAAELLDGGDSAPPKSS